MDASLDGLADALLAAGPAYAFILAFLETVWLTGVLVPCGPVVIFAAALAAGSNAPVWPIWAALALGGALGDSTHYWIGRKTGPRILSAPGFLGRAVAKHEPRARALFERRPSVAVALARLVSFVRTLTPGIAGVTGLPYRTFLPFDLLGVLGWSVLYVGIGVVAGENWQRVSSVVGLSLMALFAVVVVWAWRRAQVRHRAGRAAEPAGSGPAAARSPAPGEVPAGPGEAP